MIKDKILLFWLLTAFALLSCDSNVKLSPSTSRIIASEHLERINGQENLPRGIKELLYEEQNPVNPLISDIILANHQAEI